jgi:DNA-binding CsgD family transcriptional regulator/PAS domain-containing protein
MTDPHATCGSLTEFSDIVHKIYAASADSARWPDAVEALARSLGGSRALLFTPLVGPQDGGLMFPWQMDDKYISLWATKYMAHDVWTQAAQRLGLTYSGAVFTDETLLTQEQLRQSIYFREFLSHHNVGRVCAAIIFEGAPGLPTTVTSIYRGVDAPPFGHAEREWLTLLLPHFSRALGLMHRLNFERHQSQSLRSALDRLTIGTLLLDDELRVIFANTAANTVLARNDGLSLNAEGGLSATIQAFDGLTTASNWLAQLKSMPLERRNNFDDLIKVRRLRTPAIYQLQCCSLESDDLLRTKEGASFVVFVTDPAQVLLPTADQLQRQLGLTPAEAHVALSLTKGLTYREAAQQRHVTEETLRSQVKAIYAKTRVCQKNSLTRLVLSLGSAAV